MLRKSFHGWRLKHEIQKSTAIRSPSPRLNPIRESPGLPTRPTPLWLSPVSTIRSSFATGHPLTAACYSRVPEHDPNTANIFTHRKAYGPSSRVVLLTGVYGEGKCGVFVVPKPQESCGQVQVEAVITYLEPEMVSVRLFPGLVGTLESLKRHMKGVEELEVDIGHAFDLAFEEAMMYACNYPPCHPPEQVVKELEVDLGCPLDVAFQEANIYCNYTPRYRPEQVAKMSLKEKVDSMVGSYVCPLIMDLLQYYGKEQSPSEKRRNTHVKGLPFWEVAVAQVAILYKIYFGRKK